MNWAKMDGRSFCGGEAQRLDGIFGARYPRGLNFTFANSAGRARGARKKNNRYDFGL